MCVCVLQDKYTSVMRSKAELLDRSEILEYENMQLQAESETINEYISLYHQQRSIMKSRAEDKDRYVYHQHYLSRISPGVSHIDITFIV